MHLYLIYTNKFKDIESGEGERLPRLKAYKWYVPVTLQIQPPQCCIYCSRLWPQHADQKPKTRYFMVIEILKWTFGCIQSTGERLV